jgi:hypothetical protein
MVDYPLHSRIHLNRLSQETGPPLLDNIAVAINKTKSEFSGAGRLNSHGYYRSINENNKDGFAQYMDQSANFIRRVASGSYAEYADELWDGGNTLKQEIMAKMDHENRMAGALPGNSIRDELRNDLEAALDSLIKRKVEDFELGFIEGREMNATIQNKVTIINSSISNAIVQITQSGKDAISKDTALKLQELVNSEEIKALPENDRLDVLDQVGDLIKELQAPTTDAGKVHRGTEKARQFRLVSSVQHRGPDCYKAGKRWSCFLRQAVKVDSAMKRVIHHEDAETVFG